MTISSNEFDRSRSRGYESFLEQIYGRALAQLERTRRMLQRAAAAAPVGRQDFLIPKAWNQLVRFRGTAPPSCIEI
jgi:hypothetical protein